MKTPIIWKKLLIENRRVVSSDELRTLAKRLDKDEWNTISYLQRHDYLVRIMRGIFYVKSADERERHMIEPSANELIASALKVKGVGKWYFALETALKINNMTHEFFAIDFIITDSFWTSRPVPILKNKVQFFKWSPPLLSFGIKTKNGIRFSDPEKTVLDMTYRKYRRVKDSRLRFSSLVEYQDQLDEKIMETYLCHYSERFQNYLRSEYEGVL